MTAFTVSEWSRIDELVSWCKENVGHLVWTNNMTDWIGYGWYISRISGGFKIQVDNPEKRTLALLKWI